MEVQEKNSVSIVLNLIGSSLTSEEVSLYLNVEAENIINLDKNCWSIKTQGSLILENEWQSLRNILNKGWDKIPQLLSLGGKIEITFLSQINDRYPVIIMSPQIIKDIAYLKANVHML